ncbi:chromate transporter [Allofustis seminis]|uniref:chromate transporter n=1 Tax=Allofustis seminis TaxID=166939 RepID=UPI0003748616|nr:chromate transporter [Allofustis seminis]
MSIYWELFIAFLKIGALSFGGGYAAVPLIQEEIVTQRAWLTMGEFTDLITVSQMTPGPIAVNSATFVGLRVAGPVGGVLASVASVLPAIILVSCISWLYFKYRSLAGLQSVLSTLRPAVVAMIATAGVSIMEHALWPTDVVALDHMSWHLLGIFVFCVFALVRLKWHPIAVIIFSGVLNVVAYGISLLFAGVGGL